MFNIINVVVFVVVFFVLLSSSSSSLLLIPVAAWSKAWVYGRSLAGTVGSNPDGGMDVCLL